MKYTNLHNLPTPIFDAISNPSYDSGESDITVTQLINSPKIVAMESMYKDQIEIDIIDDFASWVGSTIHDRLELCEKIHPVEDRLYAQRDGWKIGGKFDRLYIGLNSEGELTGEVQDWKCILTSGIKFQKWEWEAQLNLLAFILRENGYTITSLKIYALLIDWRKKNIGRITDYPECPVVGIDINMWTHGDCEEYIAGRVALHKEAQLCEDQTTIELCTPSDKWSTGDKYKVKKEGRISSLRNLTSHEEAEDWIQTQSNIGKIKEKDIGKISIEVEKGIDLRCKDYCIVSGFCTQYQNSLKEDIE